MSLKMYCKACGNPTSYGLGESPKFCASCGKSFSDTPIKTVSASKSIEPPRTVLKKRPLREEIYDEEDEDCGEELPQINNLDVEIEVGPNRGEKIGAIMETSKVMPVRKDPKKMSKKAFAEYKKNIIEQTRKEAGKDPYKWRNEIAKESEE